MEASRKRNRSRPEETRALQIIGSIPGFAWSADAAGRFTYVSPSALAFLGGRGEDLNTPDIEDEFGWRGVVHPDDYDRVAARWRHCLKTGDHYDTEHRLRRADGIYRWFRNSGWPSRDGEGRVVEWFGTTIDIDEQKSAEAALRERERELSQLVDMVPSHLWRLTPDGEPIFFNRRMVDFIGFDVADMERPGMTRLQALVAAAVHPDDVRAMTEALAASLASGEPFSMLYRLRRADGAYRWMSSRAEPMRDGEGRIVQWYGLCHDIDSQVKAEELSRQSERQLRQIIDAVPALVWCMTPEGAPSYINRQLKDVVGITLEELTAPDALRSLADVHPDDRPAVARALAFSLKTGTPFAMNYRQLRADGQYRWTDGRAEPVRDETGAITQWYGVCIDVDDLVTTQQALRNRELELSQLVDMTPSHVWRLTPQGEPNFVNKRLADFLGLGVDAYDKPGMNRLSGAILTSAHPEDAPEIAKAIGRSLVTGEPFAMRWRVLRWDGVYRWVESRAEAVRDEAGVITQWYGVNVDIDDQIRAEEALREHEARIRRLVDSDIIGIVIWDLDGTLIDANDAFLRMVQYERKDVAAGLRWFDMTPPDWQEVHAQEEAAELAATGKMQAREKEYFRKDGSRVPVLIGAACFEGQSRQGVAYILDLTEHKRAEAALRDRERFLWQLVETLPAMIDCAAPDGEPVYRSRQLREFLGYDLEELDGNGKPRLSGTLDAGVHPDDLAGVKERYAHSLATGEPYARRHRLRRFDGEYRWVETRAAPMRDAAGTIVQWNVICLDVDGEVRAQEQLRLARDNMARQAQAASLAELSASIAHEVNQPLAAIVANSHACHRWLQADPPNLERARITVERIVRDANSAADVVGRIRALFKQSTGTRSAAALGAVVADVRDLMAEEAARRSVRIDIELKDNLPAVAFDRTQIQQVLFNLMRNGLEAMEGVDEGKVLGVRARATSEGVRIEIADRGPGVQFPDKVFEPFFTTKGEGMGMGLAICRSIVESHGGRLWVEGNEPRGAKFIFTLPVEAKAEA